MTGLNRRDALTAAALTGGLALAAAPAGAAPKGRKPSPAEQIDALASRAAIEEVLFDYARGNDHADEAMIRGCFWPESQHKHGKFEGKSQDFVGFAMKILVTLKYCKHHISNVSVRISGDRAFSECYYNAHHRRPDKTGTGEEDQWFEGRYIDLWERRGGQWKIIARRGMSDWNSPVAVAEAPYAALPAGSHAERSKDDEYYRILAQFEAGK